LIAELLPRHQRPRETLLYHKESGSEFLEFILEQRRRFRADLARQRLLVARPIAKAIFTAHGNSSFSMEQRKAFGHSTTLQLAFALDLRQLGYIEVLVAADQRLCRVAPMTGCSAVNPEKPVPVLVCQI
jgi:hypothetical protein